MLFRSGYDIVNEYDRVFTEFDEVVGRNYLCAIHLNDSKKPLGSRVDRHDSIGKGLIGIDFFRRFMQDSRFDDMPVILETQKRRNACRNICRQRNTHKKN